MFLKWPVNFNLKVWVCQKVKHVGDLVYQIKAKGLGITLNI